jgi:hypothetical protein
MFRKRQKYRPGIDELPPSGWKWLLGAIGLAGVASFMAALAKRLAKPPR